jgi:hypothetical protein
LLKYKILIKFYVLSFVLICCVYGDTVQTEEEEEEEVVVVVVGLLVTL